MRLGALFLEDGPLGQHVVLGLVQGGGELRRLSPDLVGHGVPVGPGGLGSVLGEGDEGQDVTALLLPASASAFRWKRTRQSCQVALRTSRQQP